MNGLSEDNPFLAHPGNERIKKALFGAYKTGRLSNAILFIGPTGCGKFRTALVLARLFICAKQGCGICRDCVAVESLSHPDLTVIIPTTKDDHPKENPEKYELVLKKKVENPYYMPSYRSKPSITIDTIKDLSAWLSFMPSVGKEKVAILVDADKMTEEAQNAFLKTLEEPPPNSRIILTSASFQDLLPTILSRLEKFFFTVVPENEILGYLMKMSDKNIDRIRLIARISNGDLQKATKLCDEIELELRDTHFELFLSLFEKTELKLLRLIRKKENLIVEGILDSFISFARDCIVLSVDKNSSKIVNIDKKPYLLKLVNRFSPRFFIMVARAIEQASAALKSYPNQSLQILHIYFAINENRKLLVNG